MNPSARRVLSAYLLSQWVIAAPAQAATQTPVQEAQTALPTFLRIADSHPSWARHLRVKVTVREGRNAEQFWLDSFRAEAGEYKAQLLTQPQRLTTARVGEQLLVKPSAIEDWTYDDERTGLTHGHFSICAELAALPAEEAAEQRSYWKLACKP